jgi:hypothetical protein
MEEARDSRWIGWLLLIAIVVVAIVVALFFLRNVVREDFGGDAAYSVSNAPGP